MGGVIVEAVEEVLPTGTMATNPRITNDVVTYVNHCWSWMEIQMTVALVPLGP